MCSNWALRLTSCSAPHLLLRTILHPARLPSRPVPPRATPCIPKTRNVSIINNIAIRVDTFFNAPSFIDGLLIDGNTVRRAASFRAHTRAPGRPLTVSFLVLRPCSPVHAARWPSAATTASASAAPTCASPTLSSSATRRPASFSTARRMSLSAPSPAPTSWRMSTLCSAANTRRCVGQGGKGRRFACGCAARATDATLLCPSLTAPSQIINATRPRTAALLILRRRPPAFK